MSEVKMVHTAVMGCSAEQLFDYLTQPRLWHEWHPNSAGASYEQATLSVGDTFEEEFQIQLIPWLPLRIQRHFVYEVLASERPRSWEIQGAGRGIRLRFVYTIEDDADGCRFTRQLRYQLHGPLALLGGLARRRNRQLSEKAMTSLAARAGQLGR